MRRFVVALLAALVLGHILVSLREAGVFRTVRPHYFGDERGAESCRVITGLAGPEDLVRIGRSTVLVSSCPFPRIGPTTANGALYLVEVGAANSLPRKLESKYPASFHPHGLDAIRTADGNYRVAVINHAVIGSEEKDEVDFFDLDPKKGELVFQNKMTDPLFGNSLNDLVLTGPDRFYATADHAATSALGKSAEDFLRIGRGYVVYVDGTKVEVAYPGIAFANGIIVLPNSGEVIVASMVRRKILRFSQNSPGVLTLKGETSLNAAPDNLFFDPKTHSLWIAAHPKLLELKKASEHADARSPSTALRIRDFSSDRPGPVEEVFADLGNRISGLSTAMVQGGRLLFGAVYGDRILDCPLPKGSEGAP